MDADVLIIGHGRTEVEIFDVEGHIPRAFVGVGDCTVNVDFCVESGNGWRAWVAWVIESVASSSETYAVCFGFLRSNTTHEIGVSHFSIFRNVDFGDGEHGTSARDALVGRASYADAVWEKAPKLVSCTASPSSGVFSL